MTKKRQTKNDDVKFQGKTRKAWKSQATKAIGCIMNDARKYNEAFDAMCEIDELIAREKEKRADEAVKEALGIQAD